ncbi:MAG: putative lipid II flippase FtsW [Candidatus Geothermincolia bacterium]
MAERRPAAGRGKPAPRGRAAAARGKAAPARSGKAAPARGKAAPARSAKATPARGKAAPQRSTKAAPARGKAAPARSTKATVHTLVPRGSAQPRRQAAAAPRPAGKRKGGNLYWWLTAVTLLLVMLGLLMIFSASSNLGFSQHNSSFHFLKKQAVWALIGLAAMLALQRFDYHQLCRTSNIFAGVTFALLVAVLLPSVGSSAYGSTRWIVIGPIVVQPSELAKFAAILFAAYHLNHKRTVLGQLRELLLPVLAVCAAFSFLVLVEPDLGTSAIIGMVTVVMLWLAGAKRRHIAWIASLAVSAGFFFIMTSGYRKARFFAFLDPWAAPQAGGFHIIQSMVALGTGSLKGLGLGMSRQKYFYLPNAHTDFLFAIVGEEFGIIGTMVVLFLFTALVLLGIRVSLRAPDALGRLLAAGITTALALQAFINMGAVTGILPITGVTLPLMSFGGSSLVISLCFVGILLNVSKQATGGVSARPARRDPNESRDMRRRDRRTPLSAAGSPRRTGIA